MRHAAASCNSLRAADDFSASNSLVRLEQISESVHALEKAAARGSVRANCLTDRLIKIDSLVIVVRGMVDVRAEHLAAGNNTAAEGDQLMIQTAITPARQGRATGGDYRDCQTQRYERDPRRRARAHWQFGARDLKVG